MEREVEDGTALWIVVFIMKVWRMWVACGCEWYELEVGVVDRAVRVRARGKIDSG